MRTLTKMRTITRKTNVRKHARNCKTPTTVRQHNRNVTRQVLGTVRVKDLTYKQSKKIFPRLPANQDWDGDGVPNKRDCRPFDEERQDFDMYTITDKRKRKLNQAFKEHPSKFIQNQLEELKREEMERDLRNKQLVSREILKDRFGAW
jgi:hypothetical protein